MIFHVGPFEYELRLTDDKPRDDRGRPCHGLCDFVNQKLLVWTGMRGQSRLSVLIHELTHAWRFHFPPGRDEESQCDASAGCAVAAMKDLNAQGGVEVLYALLSPEQLRISNQPRDCDLDDTRVPDEVPEVSLSPIATVTAAEVQPRGYGGRVQCAQCCKIVSDAAVVNGRPRFDDHVAGTVLARTLYCDFCHHLQSWDEACTRAGAPTGVPTSEPQIITDREKVETFLRDHPQSAGVMEAC